MKRYIKGVTVAALALTVAGLLVNTRRVAAQSDDNNGGVDKTFAAAAVSLANASRGVVFKTAAINSTGSVAKCFNCVSGTHLGTGSYQIVFDENVQATNGWSRWVQVDALSNGFIANVTCTTADRNGVTNGVFVACFNNSTGARQDTSFFLFVAR